MTGASQERALDELAQAYVERLRRGDPVTPEDYCRDHPALASRIRELFPVLAMMEGLGPGGRPARQSRRLPGDGAIGPYRLRRELGQGGMGRVFEAVDEDGTRVALKLVHAHLVGRAGYLARFLREFEAGQRVDHDGVVRTLASGIVDLDGVETPYLVLEYVEGQNLGQLIAELAPLSERLCRLIAGRVAEGLTALHDAGLVHRDVKPENVVITHDERIKLMDLGVAFVQDEQLRLSNTGDFIGSLLYAAPEQIRGTLPDARTDLYGLGMLLYEAVTGVHPEALADGRPPRTRNPNPPAPSARARVPTISQFFDRVIATLMEPDPADRFESAAVLCDVLRDGQRGAWWSARAPAEPSPGARGSEAPAHGSPLIGRQRELAALQAAYRDLCNGRGGAVVLVGEAGMGKTRLLDEWLDALDPPRARPLQLVVAESGPEVGAGSLAATLLTRLGSDAGDALAAVRKAARTHMLVIAVEDLHFATVDSLHLFGKLVRLTEYEPLLVVGTARPEAGAWSLENVPSLAKRLVLKGLSMSSAHDLFRVRVGSDISPGGNIVDLVRASDGNPLCLVAFAETFKDRGPIEGRIPESIQELVEARLRDLDDASRTLLDVAACCGNEFDPLIVCDAAEVPRLRGLRTLHELDRKHGLIVMRGAQYRFRHHVVLEVLSASLPPALRTAYHGVLGVALEERLDEGEVSPAQSFRIARHHVLGGRPERAGRHASAGLSFLYDNGEFARVERMARALLALGDQLPTSVQVHAHQVLGLALADAGNTRDGIKHLEIAFERRDQAPERAASHATIYAHALRHAGQLERAIDVQMEVLAEAELQNDENGVVVVMGRLAVALGESGRTEEARDYAQRSLKGARRIGDAVAVSEAARCLGDIEMESGQTEQARPLLMEAIEMASAGRDATRASALNSLARLEYIEGRYQAAIDMQERLVMTSRVLGHAFMEVTSRINIAQAQLDLGRFEEAGEELATCVQFAERLGQELLTAFSHMATGQLRESQGQWGHALRHYDVAVEAARGRHLAGFARSQARRAGLLAWMGDFDQATALVDEALDALRSADLQRGQSQVRCAQAMIHATRGDAHRARELLQSVLAESETQGHRGEQVRILRLIGSTAQALGDTDAAASFYAQGQMRSVESASVEARLLKALSGSLPDGAGAVAVLSLDEHAASLPVHDRLWARHWLANRLGDDVQHEAAAAELEGILETLTPEQREAARDVPLHRAILDAVT